MPSRCQLHGCCSSAAVLVLVGPCGTQQQNKRVCYLLPCSVGGDTASAFEMMHGSGGQNALPSLAAARCHQVCKVMLPSCCRLLLACCASGCSCADTANAGSLTPVFTSVDDISSQGQNNGDSPLRPLCSALLPGGRYSLTWYWSRSHTQADANSMVRVMTRHMHSCA